MTSVNEVFGQRVRRLRHHRRWSLRVLHEQSGVAINTLSRTENGHNLYLYSACKLAEALGTDLGRLVGPLRCHTCLDVPAPRTNCADCGNQVLPAAA